MKKINFCLSILIFLFLTNYVICQEQIVISGKENTLKISENRLFNSPDTNVSLFCINHRVWRARNIIWRLVFTV